MGVSSRHFPNVLSRQLYGPNRLLAMDQIQTLERIKRLVIIALYSDDDLMERLVLKGGNLLDVIFQISSRGSMDLDFSIEREFESAQVIHEKLSKVLGEVLSENGYVAFDINVREVPAGMTDDLKDFWGGYKIDFKIIEKKRFDEVGNDERSRRMGAVRIGDGGSPKFKIDISKHEYCMHKRATLLDGYTIYTYSPEMVIAEKLRAICQQMPEYARLVKSHPSARARDFVDIYDLKQRFEIDLMSDTFHRIVREMFLIKRVPLRLLGSIGEFRDFHRPDFVAVQATVKPSVSLRDFDFYFDYVLELCSSLESLWNE
jgi:predicted nucleotidyltransferase component of viral defense system